MPNKWIQSSGGPLLLLPSELLASWGGTSTLDYERACETVFEIEEVAVGEGIALVLGDEPHQTSWVPEDQGGMLVRWVYADSERDVWEAVNAADDGNFAAIHNVLFAVGGAGCVLLDSADPGFDLQGERVAVPLPSGTYSVHTANLTPGDTTRVLVHRLKRIGRESSDGG